MLAISLGIISQTYTLTAVADTGSVHQRQNYSAGVTRTTNAGRSISVQSNQTANGSSFTRNTSVELANGTNASRTISGDIDADSGTASRSVNGTRLNGSTYSREYNLEKTADGHSVQGSYTNAAGNTASITVSASQNEENGTSTVTKSITGFNGETHGSTVEKTLQVEN
jgi:hypothetical protein